MEVLELYSSVVEAVQNDQPLPDEAAKWLAEAIFLNAQTDIAIDEALGLRTPGDNSRSIRYQYRLMIRDEALLKAWEALPQRGPWEQARELLKQINKFRHGRVWRGGRLEATELEAALYDAFSVDIGMPRTEAGIRAIIERQQDRRAKRVTHTHLVEVG